MTRENNYDLLRLLACIGVIFIHASAPFKDALTSGEAIYIGTSTFDTIVILIYNTLPRYAVPIFFMLSGAFLLSNQTI